MLTSDPARIEALRQQLLELMTRKFGSAEERPFDAGVLDSLKSIEFGLMLESEFGVKLGQLDTTDFDSMTQLATKLLHLHETRASTKGS